MFTIWSAVSFLDAFRNKAAVLKIDTDMNEVSVVYAIMQEAFCFRLG